MRRKRDFKRDGVLLFICGFAVALWCWFVQEGTTGRALLLTHGARAGMAEARAHGEIKRPKYSVRVSVAGLAADTPASFLVGRKCMQCWVASRARSM